MFKSVHEVLTNSGLDFLDLSDDLLLCDECNQKTLQDLIYFGFEQNIRND